MNDENYMVYDKKVNSISVGLGILLPIECVILQYRIGVFNLGVIVLLFFSFLTFITRRRYEFDKEFFCFFLVLILQQFISVNVLNGDYSNRFWNIILAAMIVVAVSLALNHTINIKLFTCTAIKGGLILCIPLFIQAVQIYAMGSTVDSIMIFPQQEQYLHYWVKSSSRVCGLFSEPQTCASCVLPFVFMALRYKKIIASLVFSFAIVFTQSSLGVLVLVFLWGIYIISSDLSKGRKIIIMLLVCVGGLIVSGASFFAISIDKINSIFADYSKYSNARIANSTSYSNYLRLIKGWSTLREMPGIAKVVGVGISGFQNYIQSHNVYFSWYSLWGNYESNAGYYSSAAGVFIECGLIVGAVYYAICMKKIIYGTYEGRFILVLLLIQSLSTQLFFNGIFALYFFIYYIYSNQVNEKRLTFTI